jgi:hypothetical protein
MPLHAVLILLSHCSQKHELKYRVVRLLRWWESGMNTVVYSGQAVLENAEERPEPEWCMLCSYVEMGRIA